MDADDTYHHRCSRYISFPFQGRHFVGSIPSHTPRPSAPRLSPADLLMSRWCWQISRKVPYFLSGPNEFLHVRGRDVGPPLHLVFPTGIISSGRGDAGDMRSPSRGPAASIQTSAEQGTAVAAAVSPHGSETDLGILQGRVGAGVEDPRSRYRVVGRGCWKRQRGEFIGRFAREYAYQCLFLLELDLPIDVYVV